MSLADRLNSALEEPSHQTYTAFDTITDDEKQKRALRSKKFGSSERDPVRGAQADKGNDGDGNCDVVEMEIDGAEEQEIPILSVTPREDAIHLYGTDEMSTKDVLRYVADYNPARIEWINDSSCNVVFGDSITAKRALIGLTDPSHTRPPPDATNENPILQFSPGIPYKSLSGENITGLMIRCATDCDVKERGAAQKSRYYLRHGLPGREESADGDVLSHHRKRTAESEFGGEKRNGKRSILDRLGVPNMVPVMSHNDEPNDFQQTSYQPALPEGDLGDMIRKRRETRERRDVSYPVLPEGDLGDLLRGRRTRRDHEASRSGMYSDRAGYGVPHNDDENMEGKRTRNDRSRSPEDMNDQRKVNKDRRN